MRLRKPCPHDLYDEHPWDDWGEVAIFTCSGGEFLVDDAVVIETNADGEWLLSDKAFEEALDVGQRTAVVSFSALRAALRCYFFALASQVGESG